MSASLTAWPHQAYAVAEVPRLVGAGARRICLTSPTGGGKSFIVCKLIQWAVGRGWKAVVYTNRRLLVNQLRGVLAGHGIAHGVRAANYQDERQLAVQISSLPTEGSRVLKSQKWDLHGADGRALAIVDEAHLNANGTAEQILKRHHETGAVYVGVTATPIDLGHLYDTLVVAGTPSELRKCGALVPAYHFGPDEPDLRRFKPLVKTGEYREKDVVKAIMTKCVFARVLEHYRQLNADGRPTILFAPGVKESIWFAEQFTGEGIRAAHIDGEGVWLDGEYRRTQDRDRILADVRAGEIKVLTNRFVLREGLDLPEVSHLILATVMGSLQTYLQACGRGLRACVGKDRCTIQDHGGHWHRLGSVNADRQWFLGCTETILAARHAEAFREKRVSEPIRCARCGQIRATGAVCPACGHEMKKPTRMVVQVDGTLKEHAGDIYKPRVTKLKSDTQRRWESMYHRAKRSRNHMNFRQAEALFFVENHYWPPRNLPYMPAQELDWFRPVRDVPQDRLVPAPPVEVVSLFQANS
jgi:DNA repair protein RadD